MDSISAARAAPAEALRTANYKIVANALYGQFNFGTFIQGVLLNSFRKLRVTSFSVSVPVLISYPVDQSPGPIIDHAYITTAPEVALLSGAFQKPLPQVLGHNAREVGFLVPFRETMITKVLTQGIGFTSPWVLNETSFETYLSQLLPAASPSTLSDISTNIYPPPSASGNLPYTTDLDRAALLTAEVVITCNTYLLALAYLNTTYNYLFDVYPALHGSDLDYTFGPDSSTQSPKIQRAIQTYVTQFAETGNPNKDGQPSFHMYGSASQVLDLAPGEIEMKLDPAASNRCLMLQKKAFS